MTQAPITERQGGTGKTSYSIGDLLVATAATVLTKLGVAGATNGQVLTIDTGEASKMKWASLATAPITLLDYNNVVNTTSKTAVATFSVPANRLSTNKAAILVAPILLKNNSGSAENPTFDVEFGATSLFSDTIQSRTSSATDRTLYYWVITIQNKGATNSQICTFSCADAHQAASGALANTSVGTGIETNAGDRAADLQGYNTATEDTTGALTLKISITFSAADADLEAELVGGYYILPPA
jgi:hypothetical protein